MKKIVLASAIILSGVMASSFISIGSYAASPVVESIKVHHDKDPGRAIKKTKDTSKHPRAYHSKKSFFGKLKETEEAKRTHSRLPVFSKYRKNKDSKAKICGKKSKNIIINKKRKNKLCKSKHS